MRRLRAGGKRCEGRGLAVCPLCSGRAAGTWASGRCVSVDGRGTAARASIRAAAGVGLRQRGAAQARDRAPRGPVPERVGSSLGVSG